MGDSWKFFFSMVILSILVQGLFSMFEMACVSFNKIRLQYYVSMGSRRAKWLSSLLNHPGQLFGTTLIGVNTALQIGSECSRRFYEGLGLNPDWAPLTQIFLVMIFAELSPMFAGRRFAEHVAMLTIGFFYFLTKLLSPLIWLLDLFCRWVNRLLGVSKSTGLYLSREELQNLIEERDETKELNTVVGNIFALKNMMAKEVMRPL